MFAFDASTLFKTRTSFAVKTAVALGALAMNSISATAFAACPFSVSGAATAYALVDGLSYTQFARRNSAAALSEAEKATHENVAKHLAQLDLNADGSFDTTDALIAARAMLGLRNGALADDVALSGARNNSTMIQTYIDGGCVADAALASRWQSTSFTESTNDIANPERGFWLFLSNDFATVDQGTINFFQQTYPTATMGYALIRLDAYRDVDTLPNALFDAINAAFAKVRASGMKLILRFAYNSPAGEVPPVTDDAPLTRVLGHIAQITPIVQTNADVIYVWQAGFIGAWGEGHSSTNGLDSAQNKATIRDALLAAAPANRFLMWRDPKDQIAWDAQPGTEADAFGYSRQARVGMYNDCFMSSDTDVGTYDSQPSVRAQQRAYVAARSAIVPFGGETCDGQPVEQQRRTCAAILSEGAQFHMSYLNRTYYSGFLNQWQTEGCFDDVAKNLGYRWVLLQASVPKTMSRGAPAQISAAIKNVGWARLYNARRLNVRLVSRTNPAAAPIVASAAWDPRMLRPSEAAHVLFNLTVPMSAAIDTYDVYIAAPDPAVSIASVSAYAIRFANADSAPTGQNWDATRGAFKTGLAVIVQ
jgi:Domain of unknown function (DUF4832)/Domain of unknown function (DUF4874)